MTTKTFSVTSGKYVSTVFHDFMKHFWWAFLLPIVVCFSLAGVHTGFVFLALTLIFIVYPMALSFVYFANCMVIEIRWSMLSKTMELANEGVLLRFENGSHLIKWDEIGGYRAKRNHLIINLNHRRYCYFFVPYEAFNSTDDLRQFVLTLKQHLP
ncbi:MAG: YcxB family protein [Muribaculaceae bacterium]